MSSINTRTPRHRSTLIRPAAAPPQGGAAPQAFEPSNTLRTHEGAPAAVISAEMALRRSVCSCLLWEDEFYEDGNRIADRILSLADKVQPATVARLAYDARTHMNLRHVSLLLLRSLVRTAPGTSLVSATIADVIQRADELSEFLALYWDTNNGKRTMSAQLKKGLSAAFAKFDEYQLAKYFSTSGEATAKVKGRDVMFMAHAKPKTAEQVNLFSRIANRLPVKEGGADTWETALSTGKDKKDTFTRLLQEHKLGYLALLRNLRNMNQAGVDKDLVENAILERRGARRVLPFRYVAAARACPVFTRALEEALTEAIAEMPVLSGRTYVLVDVSGSMNAKLSGKSELTRMDAAATLAAVLPGDIRTFTFSEQVVEVKETSGFSGIKAIKNSQEHAGTYLGKAVKTLLENSHTPDRLIVITDEQSHDYVPEPDTKYAYMINVASNRYGVGYGPRWIHIDGFSEQVIRWIGEFEKL